MNEVLKANASLQARIENLEALVSLQDKKLVICIELIENVAHLFPPVFKQFIKEYNSLEVK